MRRGAVVASCILGGVATLFACSSDNFLPVSGDGGAGQDGATLDGALGDGGVGSDGSIDEGAIADVVPIDPCTPDAHVLCVNFEEAGAFASSGTYFNGRFSKSWSNGFCDVDTNLNAGYRSSRCAYAYCNPDSSVPVYAEFQHDEGNLYRKVVRASADVRINPTAPSTGYALFAVEYMLLAGGPFDFYGIGVNGGKLYVMHSLGTYDDDLGFTPLVGSWLNVELKVAFGGAGGVGQRDDQVGEQAGDEAVHAPRSYAHRTHHDGLRAPHHASDDRSARRPGQRHRRLQLKIGIRLAMKAPENRLAKEASPYLRQHAHNPVDWYPWGDEALAEAKRRDVPILLSIGYSACHWCHVMERECFENEAIAKKMNELFVNVKVDREERPDLDHIYQLVVQIMGRSGGWPLTVFLTPDQRPFFGGTYFPPEDRYGVPGLPKILDAVTEAYKERRDDVAVQAEELAVAIASVTTDQEKVSDAPLDATLLRRSAEKLASRFDDRRGGFGSRPKFPNTMALEVLLRRGALEGDARSLGRVRLALDAMREGGICDQLGGGFHRYSTDEKWLVPHFEKMLYDNALLLRSYVDGHRVFQGQSGEAYAATARRIVDYLMREMCDPGGAFYSAQDADSEGEEGKFFVWDEAEIRAALSGETDETIRAVLAHYGVTAAGNFEETHKTVLALQKTTEMLSVQLGLAPSAIEASIARARPRLFEARRARAAPFRDEKILASWNALLIVSLADAAMALDAPEMLDAAKKAFDFVESKLTVTEPGLEGPRRRVLRLAKDGHAKGPGFLDDHAFFAGAALALYEATGAPRYVQSAIETAEAMLAHFSDDAAPFFFFTPDDGERLIHRAKDMFDNAIPSGQAVAMDVLLRLGALTDATYTERATRDLDAIAKLALENPFGFSQSLCVLDRLVRGSVDVVLVGSPDDARTKALAREVFRAYLPNRTVAWLDPSDEASRAACSVLATGKEKPSDGPVAYVCRGRTCSLPVHEPGELAALLRST